MTISPKFDEAAKNPRDEVAKVLRGHLLLKGMSSQTIDSIVNTFKLLQLPLPQIREEYLVGTEGVLLFSNEYGVVIRIENSDKKTAYQSTRVNNNPFVLQPLGSIVIGDAVIEICPGCTSKTDEGPRRIMKKFLTKMGISYWDEGEHNEGTIKVDGKEHTLVVDRLAVKQLSHASMDVGRAMAAAGLKQDPQKVIFGDLQRTFAEAWPKENNAPDFGKMAAFWRLCRKKTQEGVLIAGWNEPWVDPYKGDAAKMSAASYDKNIQSSQREFSRSMKS